MAVKFSKKNFNKMDFFLIFLLIKAAESRVAIIGGTTTTINKYPYQLQLEWCDPGYTNCNLECGASIIGSKCALTAGHCIDGLGADQIRIRAGSTTNGQGTIYYIDKMVKHCNYSVSDEYIPDSDIAFLVFTKPFTYSTSVKSIPLAKCEVKTGDNCTITGWGSLEEDQPTTETLNIVTVKVMDHSECCSSKFYGSNRISDNMFCAGVPEGQKDACQGDSGGPCVVNGALAGIISWGMGCGRPEYPGVYTSINVFRSWITDLQTQYNCF